MMQMLQKIFVIIGIILLTACATGNERFGKKDTIELARAKAHTDLGAAYLQQNKYEIALEEFNLAIESDPNYSLAYNGLGLVHAALNQDAQADAAFKQAVTIDPLNSESQNNYGSFLCSRKRYDESIPHFLEAVKNPLYATPTIAYTNAGICSVRKGDSKNAESYLVKALQIEPLNHTAASYLGDIQFKRGDTIGAKKTIQNALISNPGPEVLWLGIKIERILGDKDNEASYALQLRQQYPHSEQTRLLLSGK
jgi:type IV pilus assembly protein PilF